MTLISPDQYDPNIPVCEKHNFRGYHCVMCWAEEMIHFENFKQISIQLSEKVEGLLIAIDTTETKNLFPIIYKEAKDKLEEFKKMI